uniref:Uncharacterized protein n=1 Tax=Oryza meridionalis TaxID=40149 RepID=A0A0E0EHC8_9ORYZ
MTTTTNLALALGAAGTSSGDDDGRGRSGAQDLSGDDKDSGSGAQELVNGSVGLRSCGALVATAMAPVAKITYRLLPRRRRHHTRVVGRAPTEISGEEQFRSAKHFAPAARADSLMVLHSAAVDARLRQCIAADLSYWSSSNFDNSQFQAL